MRSSSFIPILDISAWFQNDNNQPEIVQRECEQVAKQWNSYFKHYGYAVIIGHGIDQITFDLLNAEAAEFFRLSHDSKMRYNHGYYGHPLGGYTPPGYEKVALSINGEASVELKPKYDPVENFVFTSYPNDFHLPSGESQTIFPSVQDYYVKMKQLLKVIHSISAKALELNDINYFEQFYDETLPQNKKAGNSGDALRLAHYPPTTSFDESGVFDNEIRYGAHTDYQGFTILKPDATDWHYINDNSTTGSEARLCGGLEVQNPSTKEWIQVKIPIGMNALVINAGDLIQRWTNNHWHSPMHRVVSSASLNQSKTLLPSRQAIVFFSSPLEQCEIECIQESPVIQEHLKIHSNALYPPIKSIDHLMIKINRTNGLTN